jgi:hypothetical protein
VLYAIGDKRILLILNKCIVYSGMVEANRPN